MKKIEKLDQNNINYQYCQTCKIINLFYNYSKKKFKFYGLFRLYI